MEIERRRGLISLPASALLLICFAAAGVNGVLFDTLPNSLVLSVSGKQGQVLVAGVDKLTVSWKLNQSLAVGNDAAYKKVKVRLCYAPVSQKDRGWRKTTNDLKKDKTCSFGITIQPYTNRDTDASFEYMIERNIPTATYFVRAYALDSSETEVAYGQSTNAQKASNLFEIKGISGRHTSLDIAAACFSAFSVLSLAAFFVAEKKRKNK